MIIKDYHLIIFVNKKNSSTCSSEEAPDLYIEHTEEATCAPELNVPPNELCRKKITDIVVDLIDGGLL